MKVKILLLLIGLSTIVEAKSSIPSIRCEDYLALDFYSIETNKQTECWIQAKRVQSYPKELNPQYLKGTSPNPKVGETIEIHDTKDCTSYKKGKVFRVMTNSFELNDPLIREVYRGPPPKNINLNPCLKNQDVISDVDKEYDHKQLQSFFDERDKSLGVAFEIHAAIYEDGHLFDLATKVASAKILSKCKNKGIYEIRLVDKVGKTISSCHPSLQNTQKNSAASMLDYVLSMQGNQKKGNIYSLDLLLPLNQFAYEIWALKNDKIVARYLVKQRPRLSYLQYLDIIPINGWKHFNKKDEIITLAQNLDTSLHTGNVKNALSTLETFKNKLIEEINDNYTLIRNESISKKALLKLLSDDQKELLAPSPSYTKRCFWSRKKIRTARDNSIYSNGCILNMNTKHVSCL